MDHANTGIYEIGQTVGRRRLSPADLKIDDCDLPVKNHAACIAQSPDSPSRPALVNLTSGRVRSLVDIDPVVSALALPPVSKMTWKSASGVAGNGYLILPAGNHSQLPLLIMAYGFDGQFILDASRSLNTFPAQMYAQYGFAVLLINIPRYRAWPFSDVGKTYDAWARGPLESVTSAIDDLAGKGIVDTSRVGFMGHSWGGYWVEYAISQSKVFKAALVHNGGTNVEPGTYWIQGSSGVRDYQAFFMGGPADRNSFNNYLRIAPSLNADSVTTPILMETGGDEAQLA
ncbi:MAG TPA: prolyl oligopeptidase family serine peptidase, partial [Lacipirellulaceae bacterium]|nr:prolyl oligopeptidase family serine peptidase [Lacipirellulaceae bacterium]